jgi:hypothetical protein
VVPHPSVLRVRVLTFLFALRLLLNLFPRQNIHRSARAACLLRWMGGAREADLETYAFGALQIGNDLKQIARLRVAAGAEHTPDAKSAHGALQEH